MSLLLWCISTWCGWFHIFITFHKTTSN